MTQLILTDADLQALGVAVLKAAASDEDRMIRNLQSNSDAVFEPTPVSSAIGDWAVTCIKARPKDLSVEDAAADVLDFLQSHGCNKALSPSALRYLISCVRADERAAS